MELEEIRKEIDHCDRQLVALLEKRLRLVEDVVEYKQQKGMAIYQPHREQEVIGRVVRQVENKCYEKNIEEIYRGIMRASRRLQSKRLFPFNIVLLGFMGTGKTAIGKQLSALLEMELVDLDQLLEARMNMSINQIFEIYGEPYFRRLESELVKEISVGENIIISCGGGVILREDNIQNLKRKGRILWLRAQPETIYQRLQEDNTRPLLKGKVTISYINALLTERWPRYQAASDFSVDTDHGTIEEISDKIIQSLSRNKHKD